MIHASGSLKTFINVNLHSINGRASSACELPAERLRYTFGSNEEGHLTANVIVNSIAPPISAAYAH